MLNSETNLTLSDDTIFVVAHYQYYENYAEMNGVEGDYWKAKGEHEIVLYAGSANAANEQTGHRLHNYLDILGMQSAPESGSVVSYVYKRFTLYKLGKGRMRRFLAVAMKGEVNYDSASYLRYQADSGFFFDQLLRTAVDMGLVEVKGIEITDDSVAYSFMDDSHIIVTDKGKQWIDNNTSVIDLINL